MRNAEKCKPTEVHKQQYLDRQHKKKKIKIKIRKVRHYEGEGMPKKTPPDTNSEGEIKNWSVFGAAIECVPVTICIVRGKK